MATEAQIAANRANAQKSTGPRTPEGKEPASQNALKHGLFAREVVIRGEDAEEFERHRQGLLEQLNPVGPLEELLAARIVDLSWRLQRAVQDQSGAFVTLYERQTAEAGEPQEPAERAATLGRMIVADYGGEAVLERLLRYERRIESSLYRTLNELRRVHDQVQKAAQEEVNTLERWREEDWNARKARAFAFCPPAAVSPGPAGPTLSPRTPIRGTNTPRAEAPHPGDIPSGQYARPAPNGPAEDETCRTNPIPGAAGWDGAGGARDEGQSCKTNPISEEASSLRCPVAGESCKTNPILTTIPPDGVTTNLQGQLCETNPKGSQR